MTTASAPTCSENRTRCRLCGADGLLDFAHVHDRHYLDCPCCKIVLADPTHFLAPLDERERYLLHQNCSDDPNYRQFLNRLAEPLLEKLAPNSSGLDYGCGPGPTLSVMLAEGGHGVANYDPFFHDHPQMLSRTYDFVTATEVVEHFYEPASSFSEMLSLLVPGGILAVMTDVFTDQNFSDWHYVRDPTHVALYRPETFAWIAQNWNLKLYRPARTVAFFQTAA